MNTIYITSIYPEKDEKHWTRYSLDAWQQYCDKYKINLVVNEKIDPDVFPGRPLFFQKFSVFNKDFDGDVAIVDADSMPSDHAPNIFDNRDDENGVYFWYDPGKDNMPINCPFVELFNPENNRLADFNIPRLKEIAGESVKNPNNWFHVMAGLVIFKKNAFNLFKESYKDILTTHTLSYCGDEAVFTFWISKFFREGKINIHKLEDRWFYMPNFVSDGRYNYGPIEDMYSVQFTVHYKNDVKEYYDKWWIRMI